MMIDKKTRQQEKGNCLLDDPSCENLLMPSRQQQNLLVHSVNTSTMTTTTAINDNGSCDTNDDINNPKKHNYCGLCCCRPRWLQPFASKQVFLAVFGITWVLQGMYYTYFVSVITTIEKLFQIQSKTTGVIMSATEIGQIGSSLLLTYYGGQGHRPKWIAWSMILFAISSFTCSLPHFIYGKQLMQANSVLLSQSRRSELAYPTAAAQQQLSMSKPISLSFTAPITSENNNENFGVDVDADVNVDFAINGDAYFASLDRSLWSSVCETNTTGKNGKQSFKDNSDECSSQSSDQHQSYLQINRQIHEKITKVVLTMFFLSLLGVGMGQTAVNTLGIPFIDDNVANKESPLYFAITIGLRILGPALGFVLGSFCTRMYADFSIDPGITPTDPRWIGAWWLGLVIVSPLLIIASFAMFCFPRHLNGSQAQAQAQASHLSSIKSPIKSIDLNFRTTVKRLLKNEILMYRTASSVLHILPIAGFYTFLPKYLESQFHLAAHSASMVSGIGGIMVMGIGIIGSGVFILKFKPNARFIAGWIAITALIYSIGMGILSFIGCPSIDVPSFQSMDISSSTRGPVINPQCSWHCDCDRETFNPVCGRDGQLYFSACHAGCRNVTERQLNDASDSATIIEFHECNCITNVTKTEIRTRTGFEHGATPSNADAVLGYCNANCQNAVWYIGLFSFFVFVHSTSEVGSMLLILRCVDPKDKAMALGLIQFAIGLFGNVPCPIIYGAIVDYACLVWEKTCGQKGACWLYDPNIFRVFFHGVTGLIFLSAFVIDVIVWYKSGSIKFMNDNMSTIENRSGFDVENATKKSHENSELLQLSDSKSFENEN